MPIGLLRRFPKFESFQAIWRWTSGSIMTLKLLHKITSDQRRYKEICGVLAAVPMRSNHLSTVMPAQ